MIFNIHTHNTLRQTLTATPLRDCDQLISLWLIERHYFPCVVVVVDQKDVSSLSVGIRHIFATGEEDSYAAIPLIVSALIPVPALLRRIGVKALRRHF